MKTKTDGMREKHNVSKRLISGLLMIVLLLSTFMSALPALHGHLIIYG